MIQRSNDILKATGGGGCNIADGGWWSTVGNNWQQYHEARLRELMWRSSSFFGCSVICTAGAHMLGWEKQQGHGQSL